MGAGPMGEGVSGESAEVELEVGVFSCRLGEYETTAWKELEGGSVFLVVAGGGS